MTLMKRNGSILPEIPKLFDDFFTRDLFDWNARNFSNWGTTLPSVNIVENNDNFVVEMAAPGMKKDDFNIELSDDMLTISSEKEVENELNEDERYTRREFSYQAFQRSFQLPKNVVEDSKIHAKYEEGILRILIPKKEEAKKLPPRKIAIK
jgi:HSP20 family protein